MRKNDFTGLLVSAFWFPLTAAHKLQRGMRLVANYARDFAGFSQKNAPVFSQKIQGLGLMSVYGAALSPVRAEGSHRPALRQGGPAPPTLHR